MSALQSYPVLTKCLEECQSHYDFGMRRSARSSAGGSISLRMGSVSKVDGWDRVWHLKDWPSHFENFNKDEIALEEEAQKKAAWLFKSIFIVTAGFAAYQFFPYMGDNLLQQSISLLRVRNPLFKRMGASRLARYAVDDGRRMRVVEMGGAKELLNVLQAAADDKTRKETLKALVALSKSDEAARFLHQAGAVPIVSSISNSSEFTEIETHKTSLLEKFEKIKS